MTRAELIERLELERYGTPPPREVERNSEDLVQVLQLLQLVELVREALEEG